MVKYPGPDAGCWTMAYRPGGVLAPQLTVISEVVLAGEGYAPHIGYDPNVGLLTSDEELVTPTLK